MGDDFSAVDCAAFPFLKYALRRDPADGERFHRILDDHQQLGDDHPRLTIVDRARRRAAARLSSVQPAPASMRRSAWAR
jgi:glutathione S-transferase